MNLEQLFNRNIHKQNIQNSELPHPLSEEYLDFINSYDVKNIKTKDAKIHFKHGRDNFMDFLYLSNILEVENLIRLNKHFYTVDVDDILIETGLVIIGETSAGSVFVCIGTFKSNFGEIFIYGWDLGIIKIAENLQSFFDSLEIDKAVL